MVLVLLPGSLTLRHSAVEHLLHYVLLAQMVRLYSIATSRLGVCAFRHVYQRDPVVQKSDDSHQSDNGGSALARGSENAFVDVQPVSTVWGSLEIDT